MTLASNASVATVPSGVIVGAGKTSATFTVRTTSTRKNRTPTISAIYAGVTKTFEMVVKIR